MPDIEDDSGRGRWTYIFDLASNGNTLECLSFRKDGLEVIQEQYIVRFLTIFVQVISKSSDANVRVWNLESSALDPSTRPSYLDIPDTQFTSAVSGDYAYGGLSDLQVLHHDLSLVGSEANAARQWGRSSFLIPQAVVEWESGLKKKR